MMTILNGWLGYGSSVQAGILSEPTDPSYGRRPFVLGDLNGGTTSDVGSGTAGPAGTAWGTLNFVGVFDSPSAGSLLFWMPLQHPVVIGAGATISTQGGSFNLSFTDLRNLGSIRLWPAGAVIATTPDGRQVISGVALQFSGGSLSAQSQAFGSTVVMAMLPQAEPAAGSGQLWNNGGVISIA